MYRKTMAFGRKGVAIVAISAIDIALWDLMGKAAKQPCYRLMGPDQAAHPRLCQPTLFDRTRGSGGRGEPLQGRRLWRDEAALRLGPTDGAEGMARNIDLVRTVRETVGDEIDIMADAYMGWSLDYAKRMMRLLEPFNLRWLEEAIIPDDVHGYHELRRFGSTPIAAGEHESPAMASAR